MRVLLVAMALLGGCHADQCTWDVERTMADATVTLTRDGLPLAATVVSASVESFRNDETPSRAEVSARIAVVNDKQVETIVVVISVGHALMPSESLADLGSRFRLVQDSMIVSEGTPTGLLAFGLRDVRCEENDGSGTWSCGTNADATLDAAYEGYALSLTLSQREAMHEMCRSCDGIEACNY